MKIRVGCDLTYSCAAPTPMVLMLNVHPDRAADLLAPDLIRVAPHRPLAIYTDMFGNICARLVAPAGDIRIMTDTIVSDSGLPDPVVADAQQHPVADLPHDALMFLMGSRYCETDRLVGFRLEPVRQDAARLGARAGDLSTSCISTSGSATCRRAPTRSAARGLRGARRRVPRLCASRHHAVPLHEHSGALLHRLSRRHRRAARSGADGFQRAGSRSISAGAGTPSMRATTRRASAAS